MTVQPTAVRASLEVEDQLFRVVAGIRVVVTCYSVLVTLTGSTYDHPRIGAAILVAMVIWSAATVVIYAAAPRRTAVVLVVDLALALGLLIATPVVKGPWFQASIPGFWIVGSLLAWAVRFGWRGGLAASVLLGATDLLIRTDLQQHDVSMVFLLGLAGPMVGFVSESLQRLAAERDQAQREAAAAAERVRLGRVVHDGALQVLALMQRRGSEAGGDLAELGRLAGEQEEALRSLIRNQDALVSERTQTQDLAAAISALDARTGVNVAVPGGPVVLPGQTCRELVAVVAAALENVRRHVGPDAPAWVLLEDLGDRVVISVRDEGPGIPAGRLEAAVDAGRLGVSESIQGRIRDLGGQATLHTGPSGTEWEFELEIAVRDGQGGSS